MGRWSISALRENSPAFCFDAFSSREPVSTSLENAPELLIPLWVSAFPAQRSNPGDRLVLRAAPALVESVDMVAGNRLDRIEDGAQMRPHRPLGASRIAGADAGRDLLVLAHDHVRPGGRLQ